MACGHPRYEGFMLREDRPRIVQRRCIDCGHAWRVYAREFEPPMWLERMKQNLDRWMRERSLRHG